MSITPLVSTKNLGIALEGGRNRFVPGDTIIGEVTRQTQTVSPSAAVIISLHGRILTEQTVTRNDHTRTYRGNFTLIDDRKFTFKLFEGPLHIPAGSSPHTWPFAVTIPTGVDPQVLAPGVPQEQSYLPLNPEALAGHGLPSYFKGFPDDWASPDLFVDYHLKAELQHIGQGEEETHNATMPILIHNPNRQPPIADFQMKNASRFTIIKSQRLLPGMEEAKLSFSQHTAKFFHSSSVPSFVCNVEVGVPGVIQIGHSDGIPFSVRVVPDWRKTSEEIRGVPQKVKLTKMLVEIQAHMNFLCEGRFGGVYTGAKHTWDDLRVERLLFAHGKTIYIPCTDEYPAIDVGAILNLQFDEVRLDDRGIEYVSDKIVPDFLTYSINRTHTIKWEIEGEIADEDFKIAGNSDIVVLPRSEPEPQSWMAPPPEDRETEWWEQPPAGDAPPSFAQVQQEYVIR